MRYRIMNFMRRNTFLINTDLQYTFLFSSTLYVFLFLAAIGTALFIPLFVELGKGSGSSAEVRQAASEIVLYLHANFWPAALFSIILIGLLSIRTSHRIAGPIYQITLVLESLKNGYLPKAVHVRKGDRLAVELDVSHGQAPRPCRSCVRCGARTRRGSASACPAPASRRRRPARRSYGP